MSAFRPPSGRKGSTTAVVTRRAISPTSEIGRRHSFTGTSSRISNGGRDSPITGVRSVNRIMDEFDRDIAQTSVGMRGLVIGNTQAQLEELEEKAKNSLNSEIKKMENMESRGKTPLTEINKQQKRVNRAQSRLEEIEGAITTALRGNRKRKPNDTSPRTLKRTKSTEGVPVTPPPRITSKPPTRTTRPEPRKSSGGTNTSKKTNQSTTPKIMISKKGAPSLASALRQAFERKGVGGKENVVESQAPTRTNSQSKPNQPKKPVQRRLFTSNNNQKTSTGAQKETTPTGRGTQLNEPPSIKKEHGDAKKRGSENLAEERRKRREREGQPRARRSLEPIFNQIAKQNNTPPGITKTNIERLLQPFKQPVTVTVAPSISVKGGSAKATGGSLKQTQIQYKTPANKKKKPLKLIRSPETMRKEKSAAFRKEIISKLRSPAATKRREALYSLRTPTVGQRKKHVIQMIDRVLRRMKAPKDVEKKLIKVYEALSEKQIKSLFGGRSPEFVKKTLKRQVEYLKKKR